jgi:uncharacterized protein
VIERTEPIRRGIDDQVANPGSGEGRSGGVSGEMTAVAASGPVGSVGFRIVASTRTRRRPYRLALATGALVAPVAGVAVALQYYHNQLLLPAGEKPRWPVRVTAAGDGTVTLRGEDADMPGLVGLEWAPAPPGTTTGPSSNPPAQGYARLGPDIHRDNDHVVRELIPYPDSPPPGIRARVDHYATPSDPGRINGIDAEEVTFDTELGATPATYFPGTSDRWVIFAHGHRGSRAAGYRLLTALAPLGYHGLTISYRNDPDAPADPTGRFGLGLSEAEDLAAAVRYAHGKGAADVVLVGYSMGGAVVGYYLRRHGSYGISGVVYDSPVLSWSETLAHQARNRRVPAPLVARTVAAVQSRTRLDFDALDQLHHAGDLDVPILLIHGTADLSVPVDASDQLVAARPDLVVTYRRLDGVGHGLAWNADPDSYVGSVTTFLDSVGSR